MQMLSFGQTSMKGTQTATYGIRGRKNGKDFKGLREAQIDNAIDDTLRK